jgi:hypothetical protein
LGFRKKFALKVAKLFIIDLKWGKIVYGKSKLFSFFFSSTVKRGYSGQISCLTLNSAKMDVFISLQTAQIS